jgi:coenzyme F420-reducing hydrogenase delta subunit
VPRTDGRAFKLQAQVDPSRCVGCGICNGSCASAGSGLPHFDTLAQRARAEAWIEEMADGSLPMIAYLCHDAVPAWLEVDGETGACLSLPGYRVMRVPCAGWVHAITVERLLRAGSPGVLIAGCAGSCRFREGLTWAQGRMKGAHPTPLSPRVEPGKVAVVECNRLELSRLVEQAAAFKAERTEGVKRAAVAAPGRGRLAVGTAVLGVVSAGVLWVGNAIAYVPPQPTAPRLALSFKHPGVVAEKCRTLSAEEKAKLPAHMQHDTECVRGRQPVRVKLLVDGKVALERSYAAAGLWGDGSSVALEEFDVPAGTHVVAIALGDTADDSEWTYHDEHTWELAVGRRYTVLFDRSAGFTWH